MEAGVRRALTSKQQRFVQEYLVDLNASGAARRAGYSAKSAGSTGHRLLLDSAVQEAVEEGMKEREKRTAISQDKVVRELAHVAFGDMRSVAQWGPEGVRLHSSRELADEEAALIAEVSEGAGHTLRIKRHDKLRALELLGKHLGMFTEAGSKGGEPEPKLEIVLHGEDTPCA